MDSLLPVEMQLRFQLPSAALPLQVEKATLHMQVRAPSRRVTVAGLADGQWVQLESVVSPGVPIRIELTEEKLLKLDDQGGLHVHVAITNEGQEQFDTPWKIESLGLEVIGRTAPQE